VRSKVNKKGVVKVNNKILNEKAKQIRVDIIKMLYLCQSGHPGSSLSCVEILMALYYKAAKIDATNLADKGYFPREDLWNLRQINSHLQGHPDMKKTPGIDVSSGSLGQGASIAVGLALAAKHKKADYKVYVVIGDGEVQEGIVWEAAMAAAHYKLDNLAVLLDYNGLQIDGSNDQVMSIGNIMDKYRAFGFECIKVDGHDIEAITEAINVPITGKPKFICCETIKGKGVSFMENKFEWHGRVINTHEYRVALKELGVTANV
jgi:transketolase